MITLAGAGFLNLAGCSRGLEAKLAPVSGRITYGGHPLSHGQIVMIHSSGRVGAGEIGADGRYQLQAAVGENKVMIQCADQPNLSQLSPTKGRALQLPRSLIPKRYTSYTSSGLRLTVVDGKNIHDWRLVD